MHPSFRALLKQNGPDKLAAKVSDVIYPVNRPDAALSDPYEKADRCVLGALSALISVRFSRVPDLLVIHPYDRNGS